ncbi:MAG: hypothetical protein HOP15_17555 [Planctomycetes bacterium]|nr:hypothetical protein [Planctomycetota bacterium]
MPRRLTAILFLVFAVAWGAWLRVDTALSDAHFDAHDPRGLLRSDPAVLYYFTESILEAGGGLPVDFRADARVQHPFVTDVPAEFPVGQEFLVAWVHRHLGGDGALHVTALWVMGFTAALFVVGTFLCVHALTRSALWAALASLLALFTPANYRTLGFVLVGEDVALPLFALHLGCLALAARSGRARDYLLSGACAAAALATWHASSFVLAFELGVLFLGLLVTGRSPLASPRAWLVLVAPLAAGVFVPVLRASGLLVSPAAALFLALALPAYLERRRQPPSLGDAPLRVRVRACLVLCVALPVFGALAPDSYAHVHEVVWAKLRHFGRLPADPNAISFDARLLWQGPFEGLSRAEFLGWCGWPLAGLFAAGALTLFRRRRAVGGFELLLPALALASLPAAWLFARLVVLPGLFAPAVAAVGLAAWRRRGLALGLFGVLLLVQAHLFAGFVREHESVWYLPPVAQAELRALVEWVDLNLPADEPIAGDFLSSTALLAHTRRPIVLQPKYETERSRRQIEAFLMAFFHGSPAELAELLRTRFRCRTLLVDRYALWELMRTTAGLSPSEREPRPGTAAAALLTRDEDALRAIPGFELIYRGKPGIPWADYRLFRLP